MTDVLTPLIDAYRAENSPQSLDARTLRTRILVASARRHQNPLRRLRWLLLPVAAAFIATGSLAATPSTRPALARAFAHIAAAFRVAPPAASPPPRATPISRPSPAPATPLPTLSPHPDLPVGPIVSDHASTRAPTPSAFRDAISPSDPPPSSNSPSPSNSPSTPSPSPSSSPSSLAPDLSAYGVAHRLHFEAADYTRALTAWNGYLTRFPTGTFAPEARLNRAVCLAHLGRTTEARAALTAIAQGTYGRYGREQAQRLLDALPRAR